MHARLKAPKAQIHRKPARTHYRHGEYRLYRVPATETGGLFYFFLAPGEDPGPDAEPATIPRGYRVHDGGGRPELRST